MRVRFPRNSYPYAAPATTLPEAWLYHVIATASGTTDSSPSNFDYATTANILFAEYISSNGVTLIRGAHVQELRRAIDEVRRAASLEFYMPSSSPSHADGWVDYSVPTGLLLASDQTAMRAALDQAVVALTGLHLTLTGTVPANGIAVWAYHLTQLRNGVK